ncbi:MAG: hypothetical protein ACFFCV_02855 [Promethearchaeota archaeon]
MLLIESISDYSKKDIDVGKTPIDVYRLSSCIREAFCLSYALRKDNNLFLYVEKNHSLIRFDGKELQYLGPDERSETLLLMKALDEIRKLNSFNINEWRKSTPGIFVRKFSDANSFMSYYKKIANHIGFIVKENSIEDQKKVNFFEINQKPIEIMDNDFFIIPTYTLRDGISRGIELFKKLNNTKLISLSKIKNVEDKILYINFRKDQQNTYNSLGK